MTEDNALMFEVADYQMVSAHRLDRDGTVVVGQLLPYDQSLGERVKDQDGVTWGVLSDSVRPLQVPAEQQPVKRKGNRKVLAFGIAAAVAALGVALVVGLSSNSVDPDSMVGLNAGSVSRVLHDHGYTSVTFTTGTDVATDPQCMPYTVVDRVNLVDDTRAVLSTHISDSDAMTRWSLAKVLGGTSESFLASCHLTTVGAR